MTCSTSFCVSMPNGPSASVVQRIDGPSPRRRVASAASSPAVTAGFEFGLMTRMSARAMSRPLDDRAVKLHRVVRMGTSETRAVRIAGQARAMTVRGQRRATQQVAAGDRSMSTKPYDLVLRGGTVATASAVFPADVAIDGETIAAIGRNLPAGRAGDRRARQAGAARRHRQPRPYRAGLGGRHPQCRHLRERHRVGGVRRHHHGDLVRRPAYRHEARRGGRRLSRARQARAR